MSADAKVAEIRRDPPAVTSVIRHTVKAGSESRYEAWLKEVTPIAQTRPQVRELHPAAKGVAQLHDRAALRYDRAYRGVAFV
jgi:antibiotic biosynthesis monooxygenase (ABM) superfamily enzyme